MIKNFELWLDESGDFNNDSQKTNKGANPSLIGGLLIENKTFPDTYINAILPESGTYHSVNENDQLARFRLLDDKLFKNEANRIVVFSNKECVMILDNNLTYLNIISEGILQLIKQLKAQYGEIFLQVLIANRVNTTTGRDPSQSVVRTWEYEKRLREKLLIGSLENTISDKEWKLITASARKEKRLMLADIICNTFFTRYRKKKFNEVEQAYIENIYNDDSKTMVFSVFESALEKDFRNYLMDNRIGEAVSNICISNDDKTIEKCFDLLKSKYTSCGMHDLIFQYKFISAYIEYYMNVVRNFDLCCNLLNNLIKYYLPLLRQYESGEKNSLAEKLEFDIKFYLLTTYTHLGDFEASTRLELECDNLIEKMVPSLDVVDYKIKLETRKLVNMINAFDFENALLCADKQVEKCNEIKELYELVMAEEDSCYDELAKALGTRLQIRIFMLRQKPELYLLAKNDSDEAISKFVLEEDKKRQYIYRVQLETEYGDYDNAFSFLQKSLDLSENSSVKEVWNVASQTSVFAISAYVRLMAESSTEWNKCKEMELAISNSGYIQKLELQERMYHPAEIVLWKYGYYCYKNGSLNAAIKYYDKAIEACFAMDDLTLNIIGMGMLFEEHAIIINGKPKDRASHTKVMDKKWNKIKNIDTYDICGKVFGNIDFSLTQPEYYWDLGRKITY